MGSCIRVMTLDLRRVYVAPDLRVVRPDRDSDSDSRMMPLALRLGESDSDSGSDSERWRRATLKGPMMSRPSSRKFIPRTSRSLIMKQLGGPQIAAVVVGRGGAVQRSVSGLALVLSESQFCTSRDVSRVLQGGHQRSLTGVRQEDGLVQQRGTLE